MTETAKEGTDSGLARGGKEAIGRGAEEIAARAGEAMAKLLAALPPTDPWSGRPAPAFRPLPPA